jgi:hypothetical protein
MFFICMCTSCLSLFPLYSDLSFLILLLARPRLSLSLEKRAKCNGGLRRFQLGKSGKKKKREETSLFYSVSFVFAPNANAEIIRDADRERERERRKGSRTVHCSFLRALAHETRAPFCLREGKSKERSSLFEFGKEEVT